MKGKVTARQGFCDVYQEDNRNGFSRPHESINWKKQSTSASVLPTRITRLLSEVTPKSTILILVVDQPVANCRSFAIALTMHSLFFQ
jgi:hypothetical protein